MTCANIHELLSKVRPSQPSGGLHVTQMEPNSTQLYLPLVSGTACLVEPRRWHVHVASAAPLPEANGGFITEDSCSTRGNLNAGQFCLIAAIFIQAELCRPYQTSYSDSSSISLKMGTIQRSSSIPHVLVTRLVG